MCDTCTEPTARSSGGGGRPASLVGRRAVLRGLTGLALAPSVLAVAGGTALAAPVDLGGLSINPRESWSMGLAPTGPLAREAAGDVRFLLVHHSVSTNDYARDAVAGLIRGFFQAHTGTKGWADVAYNFFVDRFGGIWEGRAGSLDGPVITDATGGNQGFSQLCCLIGDHRTEPPTAAALDSLTRLLAALAARYAIETSAGATTSFVSRGSNKWPKGRTVTTATIAGHRDMSLTECPGDACYALLGRTVLPDVAALRVRPPAVPSPPATPGSAPGGNAPAPPAASVPPVTDAAPPPPVDGAGGPAVVAGVVGGVVAAAAAVALLRARSRRRASAGVAASPPPSPRLERWEPAALGWSTDPAAVHVSGVTFLVRSHSALIGVVVDDRTGGTDLDVVADAGRRAAQDLVDEIAEASDPADLAGQVISAMTRAADLVVAGAVVLPDRCCLAATDPGCGVVLTADGASYRPRVARSDAGSASAGLARVTADSHDVAAVLVTLPPAPGSGGRAAPSLPRLARQALQWPSLQLGVRNHVTGPDGGRALLTVINRSVLARRVSAEQVGGRSAADAPTDRASP